jgi:hypothetical protein
MSIRETLLKAKKHVRTRVGNALGRGADMAPSDIHQEILNQHSNQSQADALLKPPFEMDFIKADSPQRPQAPEVKIETIKGITEKPGYALNKSRILLGRSPEVLDREGRIVRRNDVVFLESDEEINRSVGRTHARIWFDPEKNDFFVLDEGSRYGTRILRGGSVIEVPAGEPEGIRLQSGDEVYCGQACLRFTVG